MNASPSNTSTAHRLSRAQALRDRAKLALAGGRAQAAQAWAHRAAQLDPQDLRTRRLLARIHLRLGQPGLAMTELDTHDLLAPHHRHHPTMLGLRTKALGALDRHDRALHAAERWARARPNHAPAHRAVADQALHLKQTDRATAALRRAQSADPTDTTCTRQLARLLAPTDPQAAIAVLSTDRSFAARYAAAQLCLELDRLADARAVADALIVRRPHDPEVRLLAGHIADRRGEAEQADHHLRCVTARRGPHRARALEALALSRMHRGAFDAAGGMWWRLARAGGHDATAWAGLALCAMLKGRDRLLRRAERELSLHTARAQRRDVMAFLWSHAAGTQAAAATPGATEAHGKRSPLTNLLRSASHTLSRQARHFPDRADVHYHLALCEHAQGDSDLARRAVDGALRLNPDYTAAQALSLRLAA